MTLTSLERDTDPRPPASAMRRLTAFVLGHRRIVIVLWLIAFLAGGMGAGKVSNRLKFDFSLPGQPGYETARQIVRLYGNGGDQNPSIVVVDLPAPLSAGANQARVAAAFEHLRQVKPVARVVDYGSTGNALFVGRDGTTTYGLVFMPQPDGFATNLPAAEVQAALTPALPPGTHVSVTGLDELSAGTHQKGPGVLVETLIGALGALVVLAFVFGSFLALLPLMVAAVSIVTTLLVVLGLTYVTDVSFVVQFLVALVGLGVAIDYSLLVVTRWREERHLGRTNEEAILSAMDSAGRAVFFSGLTVAIGLLSLVVLPVPGLRSVGFGGMLIPLVSVAVSVTLLPALLATIGLRMDWPRLRHEARASRPWAAWSRGVVRHRWLAAGTAVVVLAVLAWPIFGIKVGLTGPAAESQSGPAHDAYVHLLDQGMPEGMLTPLEVLTSKASAPRVVDRLQGLPDLAGTVVSSAPDANRAGTTVVLAVPKAATTDSSTTEAVGQVRQALAGVPGVVGVAGIGAIQIDYIHAVFGHFPLMLAVIALLTFLFLARAFRSLLLPAKAVVFNLLSLVATFGVIVWFWQEGHGSSALFGIPQTGAITFWVPLMIFAFLFGLSMDYEVFILSRVREEYDRTGSTNGAVIIGLGRTGRLVTSAALILFLAFASLASAPVTDIKVFATALGVGILLDATVVRALLLPALVSLFGKWNWWLPSWAERLLFIRPPVPSAHRRTLDDELAGIARPDLELQP
ncbi:MAG TPA: MMPL family transporter [Acidimicrobiales bacterium]|nr:MMPL family transporter [Acidimicrobiales bacterium]